MLVSWVASNVALALAVALAAWIVQRRLELPGVAHVLWLLALVKLVTPPLVGVPLGDSPGPIACALGTCGCDHHSPTQTFLRDTFPWLLLGAWAAGAGVKAGVAGGRWLRFRRLAAHARPAPAEWQALATRLSRELALRCQPGVLMVPGRLPPLVVPGLRRPCVLLPAALLSELDPSQRAALLLHELVHLKRGDHLVRLLEFAVGVAYWWLPGVGAIGRRLRACEEACCDAAVVARLPDSRRDYARLLLDVIDFTSTSWGHAAHQVTAMSAADGLEKRLRAILDPAPGSRRTRLAGALVLALACAVVPCQLHPAFAGRPTSSASPTGPSPDAGFGCPTDDGCPAERIKVSVCCPS
jgi:beta-lactamase regulating signal transducer with metallopeptidase domain